MSSQEHLREQVHRLQSLVLDLTAELRELAKENKILLVRVGELEGRVNELEERASDSGFSVVRAESAPASTWLLQQLAVQPYRRIVLLLPGRLVSGCASA